MTANEALKIVEVLYAAYPSEFGKVDAEQCATLWAEMLKDYPADVVGKAVKSLIATEHFAPRISDVIDRAVKATKPDTISSEEAWQYVRKALRNGYYGSAKEYCALPEIVQRALGSHNILREWSQFDVCELDTVVKSNFMRSFRAMAESENEFARLPGDYQRMLKPSYDIAEAKRRMLENSGGEA